MKDFGGVALETFAFRKATAADCAAIVTLVNSAYRGESSRQGWTTEADLLGGQRTDTEEILGILADPDSAILLCLAANELLASAHLQRLGNTAHFGMFAVRPDRQNAGIGKHFLAQAEAFALSAWNAVRMCIEVITLRDTLIGYYERRGYRRTGRIKPFPTSERFGISKVNGLELEVLEKSLEKRG